MLLLPLNRDNDTLTANGPHENMTLVNSRGSHKKAMINGVRVRKKSAIFFFSPISIKIAKTTVASTIQFVGACNLRIRSLVALIYGLAHADVSPVDECALHRPCLCSSPNWGMSRVTSVAHTLFQSPSRISILFFKVTEKDGASLGKQRLLSFRLDWRRAVVVNFAVSVVVVPHVE